MSDINKMVSDALKGSWVHRFLPVSLWPYAQLARWERPIGWKLLMWPCWWSVPGSSWGTMAILYPMMLPLAWTICESSGLEMEQTLSIFYNVVSCVLAGSVLGDHCSPISDTTILSSLASSCNHIEHVRTQLPYALTVGIIALLAGTIPASYGMPFYLSFALGILAMYLVIRKFGKEI